MFHSPTAVWRWTGYPPLNVFHQLKCGRRSNHSNYTEKKFPAQNRIYFELREITNLCAIPKVFVFILLSGKNIFSWLRALLGRIIFLPRLLLEINKESLSCNKLFAPNFKSISSVKGGKKKIKIRASWHKAFKSSRCADFEKLKLLESVRAKSSRRESESFIKHLLGWATQIGCDMFSKACQDESNILEAFQTVELHDSLSSRLCLFETNVLGKAGKKKDFLLRAPASTGIYALNFMFTQDINPVSSSGFHRAESSRM